MYEVLDKIYVASTLETATHNIPEIIQISEQPLFEKCSVFVAENHPSLLFDCMTKNAPEMYKCDSCGFEVYLKVNLKVHMEMVHQLDIPISMESFRASSDENYNLLNILKCYNCENCDFATHSLIVLLRHQSTRHKVKRKRPPVIQIRRKSLNSSRKVRPKSTTSEWYNCEQCPFSTKCKYRFKNHIQINHRLPEDGQLYECTKCSFKTIHKCRLNSHYLNHNKAREVELFKCNLCCHRTKSKHLLKSHVMYKHTAEEEVRKFKCGYCSYRAKQRGTLNEHIKAKHTAEENIKWFLCEMCSFKCKRKTHLRQHMIRHSKNKFILCEMCSAQFKRIGNLKRHILGKHQI